MPKKGIEIVRHMLPKKAVVDLTTVPRGGRVIDLRSDSVCFKISDYDTTLALRTQGAFERLLRKP